MSDTTTVLARRPGRPCAVCQLAAPQRTHLELSLAQGVTISRISRQRGAPSKDSIRRHVQSGHLPAALQAQVEHATGLDATSILARISDIASRSRASALEAAEAGNHAALARANGSELRALMALVAVGGPDVSQVEIETEDAARRIAQAVFAVARRDAHTAQAIAHQLEIMGFVTLADDVFELTSGNEITE